MAQDGYNVLLMEEDPVQSELYSDLIRRVINCKVDVMSRIENPLDWIARSNYHLVVIDERLSKKSPNLSALGLLEQIKRLSPETSVILMSEQGTVEKAVAAIRMGAEDYLKKPFNLDSFQLAVKRGVDRKMVFGEDANLSNLLYLINSCQMISASLEQKKIFKIIQGYFAHELKCRYSGIYTKQVSEPDVSLLDCNEHEREQEHDRAMQDILTIALHTSQAILQIKEGQSYHFVERGKMTPGLFVFSFRCNGPLDYYYVGMSPETPVNLDSFDARIKMIKSQIEVTGKNIAEYMGVHKLIYMDDATGLYNTRYLNYILDREITQAQNLKRSFAVLFIDVDRFKTINDTHGHMVGTKVLNEMGAQLKRFVRESDTVFRYGGDEFVAVLSPCDLSTAKNVAERFRSAIEQEHFVHDEGLDLHFTVSIGVAIFPDHASSKRAIIDAADQAMYNVKRTTRNSVIIASVPQEHSSIESKESSKNSEINSDKVGNGS